MISASDKAKIKDLAIQYHVASVRLFGSQARGTATKHSDIDLLIRFSETASLIQVIGFKQAIEEAIHARVDVVEEGGISPYLRERILSEAVSL